MGNKTFWIDLTKTSPIAALFATALVGGCVQDVDNLPADDSQQEGQSQIDDTAEITNLQAISLRISSSILNYDVFQAAGAPAGAVSVTIDIDPNVIVGSASPSLPALTTGALAAGTTVTIRNRGSIIGAGGIGGSGGNGGSGGQPRACGRDGSRGGAAIALTRPTTIVNSGFIFGGGGGGGGSSGCNEANGGGGGAGSFGGGGGAGATTASEAEEIAFCGQDNGYRSGAAGIAGNLFAPGTGGRQMLSSGGTGGGYGLPGAHSNECIPFGGGEGGPAGFAIQRNGNALTGVANGSYDTGTGPVRGPVQ